MQPSFRPSMSESQQNTNLTVQRNKRFSIKKVLKLIRKYWYIALTVLVAIIVLISWMAINSSQDETWKRANDYFTRADYGNAEKQLSNMSIPSTADRLHIYAQTMLATQNLDKALKAYLKLYEINKDPSVKLIIGNIYNQQKKYDDAIKVYREIISDNKSNVQAYINLSTVYKLQGNTSSAIQIANDSVKNNPSSITLHELQVSMLLDDENSAAFLSAVSSLKTLNPNDQLVQALNK